MEGKALKQETVSARTAAGGVVYKRPAARTERPAPGKKNPRASAPRRSPALSAEQRDLLDQASRRLRPRAVDETGVLLELAGRRPLPVLPAGYYYKGGAARETLRRVLQPGTPPMLIRDYDLVRFPGASDRHDHELALRFMDADYGRGHGVEVVESRAVYFRTRDLTVNEVLHRGLEYECSFAALADLLRGTLRPTPYALDAEGRVQGITLMKALRLEAEALVLSLPAAVTGFSERVQVSAFEIALHLDRALAAGRVVAQEYIFSAWQRGLLLPGHGVPPALDEALAELAPQLRKGIAFFRHLPPPAN